MGEKLNNAVYLMKRVSKEWSRKYQRSFVSPEPFLLKSSRSVDLLPEHSSRSSARRVLSSQSVSNITHSTFTRELKLRLLLRSSLKMRLMLRLLPRRRRESDLNS